MDEPGAEIDRAANAVIGAAIEVHKALGKGFLESVYEEAMAIELEARGIKFVRQPGVAVEYKEGRSEKAVWISWSRMCSWSN